MRRTSPGEDLSEPAPLGRGSLPKQQAVGQGDCLEYKHNFVAAKPYQVMAFMSGIGLLPFIPPIGCGLPVQISIITLPRFGQKIFAPGDATHYTPMGEEEIRAWIEQESRVAESEGRRLFDLPRAGLGLRLGGRGTVFYNTWIRRVCAVQTQPNQHEVVIARPSRLSTAFQGIDIIKRFGYLKLSFP